MTDSEFRTFVEQEALKVKNNSVPVKASFAERFFVRKLSCDRLCPNPEDEFCFHDIGPNMGIISSYATQFIKNIELDEPIMDEPLIVQKIRPGGYMLLNGHHRWAAALRVGVKKVPVSIVNAALDGDIRKMLEESCHEKRATVDLDEVVFEPDISDAKGHTIRKLRKKKLRPGIPALFKNLKLRGYDIWVYSSEYYSIDDIRRYFRHYSIDVDGIITGMKKKGAGKKVEELVANKYSTTLHIDTDLIVLTHGAAGDFREAQVEAEPQAWPGAVIDALDGIEKNEE